MPETLTTALTATVPTCNYEDSGEAIDGFQVVPGGGCSAPAQYVIRNDDPDIGDFYFCGEHYATLQECGHDLSEARRLDASQGEESDRG